jgi:hypothetical protein
VEAVRRANAAGIATSVMVLVGIAGRERSLLHARRSAEALNRMEPTHTALLTYVPTPGSPLFERFERGELELPGPLETLQEIREVVRHLRCRTHFACNHASNFLPLVGGRRARRAPRDAGRGARRPRPLKPGGCGGCDGRPRGAEAARRVLERFDRGAVDRWVDEPRAAALLQPLLFHPEPLLRWRAVEALARRGGARATTSSPRARARTLWLMNDESVASSGTARSPRAVLAEVPALGDGIRAVLATSSRSRSAWGQLGALAARGRNAGARRGGAGAPPSLSDRPRPCAGTPPWRCAPRPGRAPHARLAHDGAGGVRPPDRARGRRCAGRARRFLDGRRSCGSSPRGQVWSCSITNCFSASSTWMASRIETTPTTSPPSPEQVAARVVRMGAAHSASLAPPHRRSPVRITTSYRRAAPRRVRNARRGALGDGPTTLPASRTATGRSSRSAMTLAASRTGARAVDRHHLRPGRWPPRVRSIVLIAVILAPTPGGGRS